MEKYSEFIEDIDYSELGITKPESKKLQESLTLRAHVICPLCGLNRPIYKTGKYFLSKLKKSKKQKDGIIKRLAKGDFVSSRAKEYNPKKETRFDIVNLDKEPFIILLSSLGRGLGFKEVGGIRLDQINMLSEKDFSIILKMLNEIEEQCKYILKKIEEVKAKYH